MGSLEELRETSQAAEEPSGPGPVWAEIMGRGRLAKCQSNPASQARVPDTNQTQERRAKPGSQKAPGW